MKKLNAEDARVLIIGSGGREHAIGIKLDDEVGELFFVPGNAGTSLIGTNVQLESNDFMGIHDFVKKSGIDLIIVGPEDPLANGIVDFFRNLKVPIIGPTQAAAKIESSKIFARNLMKKIVVPQPDFMIAADQEETEELITSIFGLPVVLKIDGLAAGKGAFVCKDIDDVEEAINVIYKNKKFGEGEIVVEECLRGQEMSVFVLCNESSHVVIGTAQDYKRLLDGNQGPNTGGMGSISPSPLIAKYPNLLKDIEGQIIGPVLDQMKREGIPFTGFLYAGLMVDDDGDPYVIEFNCRLGDPETQVILPLIESSFFDLLWKAANNADLSTNPLSMHDLHTAFVVKVAEGYPNSYHKGDVIEISEDGNYFEIIHSGTKINSNEELVTNGGRVIGVLCEGESLEDAVAFAYEGLNNIHFKNEFFRHDIGKF
jgi:phosphoribosylamine--glycine ligase